MSMNKVIHGAVRRDLARLEWALGSAEDGDRRRARGLSRAYAHMRSELVRHHEGEDRWVFPMLAGFGADPILLGEMDAEHRAIDEALHETDLAVKAYAATASVNAARRAADTMARTRHVVERHLDHEEAEIDPLFWPHEDSEEWKTVERRLRRQPLRVAGRFFAWVQDGMDDRSRAYLESSVSAPVRYVMSNVFGRGYLREIAPLWKP